MGEQSHISMDFDNIISVTLENYLDLQMKPEDDMSKRVSSLRNPVSNPKLYSTTLAKEATTVRRVLEPLFHHFDVENHWSSIKELHLVILYIHTVDVATQLTQNAKLQASVAIIGAITGLIKQLRKCQQNAAELSNAVDEMAKWNANFQYASENCISQLSKKNISNNTIIGRTTILAVHRTAQIVFSIWNISYYKKAKCIFCCANAISSLPLVRSGKDTSQAVSSILPVSVSQKVRSGSFSFQDEDIQPHGLSSVFSLAFFTWCISLDQEVDSSQWVLGASVNLVRYTPKTVEPATSLSRTEIVGKNERVRFGMRDSLAIETSFLHMKNCSLVGGKSIQNVVKVQRNNLVPVDLVKRHCFPVDWNGDNRRVLRGHWFARKGGLDWLPLHEDVAEQLEIDYRSKVWCNNI
ncbi:hypothetical protein Pint_10580 [Pistacia integerrima]|uniref:Uncharacterized protein n=1 Tax=Pistacia integerrima TaxID=434235 RepID=A0ACC0XF83_9ROSI|nr:hypothetical protein Pint_10580 [Pistacia integerrima]